MAEFFKVWIYVNFGAFVVMAVMSYFVSVWALDFLAYINRRIMTKPLRSPKPAALEEEKPNQPTPTAVQIEDQHRPPPD